jgi:hypothetical protein
LDPAGNTNAYQAILVPREEGKEKKTLGVHTLVISSLIPSFTVYKKYFSWNTFFMQRTIFSFYTSHFSRANCKREYTSIAVSIRSFEDLKC